MKVEVSNGELLDKLTILEIKLNRIMDDAKLKNIRNEAEMLMEVAVKIPELNDIMVNVSEVPPESSVHSRLFHVNLALWEIEDKLRGKEKDQQFDEEFVELARSVYILNDERAELKRAVNLMTKSLLMEEKSYAPKK